MSDSRCSGRDCPSACAAGRSRAASSKVAAVMIMPAAQKPHWNACASRNACCIGMQLAVLGEPLDRRDLAPGSAKRRHQAAMKRHAVEPHRAGAAVACVAAFLDAEHIHARAKRCAGTGRGRLRRELLAVDGEVHVSAPRELRADLLGIIIGEVTLVGRRAVHVVEIAVSSDMRVDRLVQLRRRRAPDRSGAGSACGVAAVMVSSEIVACLRLACRQ